jgi:hypothetical protein
LTIVVLQKLDVNCSFPYSFPSCFLHCSLFGFQGATFADAQVAMSKVPTPMPTTAFRAQASSTTKIAEGA